MPSTSFEPILIKFRFCSKTDSTGANDNNARLVGTVQWLILHFIKECGATIEFPFKLNDTRHSKMYNKHCHDAQDDDTKTNYAYR